MKLDTLGVQAFIAIAEQGGFGRAAESLHITQTALSRRLQNLEALLGVRLVERTTRSVALTRIGQDFLPQARRLLGDLAIALNEIRESGKALRGEVTLASIPSVGVSYLPGVFRRYSALHPHNGIRVLDYLSPHVTRAVARREAEFGINMQAPPDAGLTSIPILKDHYIAACLAGHPLAKLRRLRWKQLEPYTLILSGHERGGRTLVDFALSTQRVGLRLFYEVQHSFTALGMVSQGVGIAVVPNLMLPKGAYPRLVGVPLVDPVVSRTLVLLSRTGASLSPAAQALYDLILENRGRGPGA
jgi:DNA-binding transcriptional LysR family regulator